jgi:hypothetical protein
VNRYWTREEVDYVRDHYETVPLKEIAAKLGRSTNAVTARAKKLGIRTGRWFTAEQIAVIKRDYATRDTAGLANEIGRRVDSVYRYANSLGLKKSPEYMKAQLAELSKKLAEDGKVHRFKKGQTPPNKGLRRPGWSPGRMSEDAVQKRPVLSQSSRDRR